MTDGILFDRAGGLGLVRLNRPQALNALTLEMVDAFDRQLLAWAGEDAVRAVVVEGAGERAFAAGGDIQRLCEAGRAGDPYTSTFFWDEYILDWRVFHYPKPYVALIDGIVMGGGVGVSVLGSHRVATERTVFAMPETGIGFFPDVGATWFLPRLPGRLGLYLALTGARLGGADCYHAGIATHYVPSARLGALKAALAAAPLDGEDIEVNHAEMGAVLGRFCENPGPPPIAPVRPALERCFSGASVEAVLEALEGEGGDWAGKTRKAMLAKAPTSLKVAFEQYRRGAGLDFDAALALEYRMSQAFMRGRDFFEGVRALILDKDNRPAWQPAALSGVTAEAVAGYFSPADEELAFDNPVRRFART